MAAQLMNLNQLNRYVVRAIRDGSPENQQDRIRTLLEACLRMISRGFLSSLRTILANLAVECIGDANPTLLLSALRARKATGQKNSKNDLVPEEEVFELCRLACHLLESPRASSTYKEKSLELFRSVLEDGGQQEFPALTL